MAAEQFARQADINQERKSRTNRTDISDDRTNLFIEPFTCGFATISRPFERIHNPLAQLVRTVAEKGIARPLEQA